MANSAQDHINQIRRDKYWLDENGCLKGVNPLASDLHNSIQALAQDLNNKDTHFILELIQNAEDNAYQVAEPSLSLKLLKTDPTNTNGTSGALIFQNNEVGFLAENVNAICAVGHTTKSKVQGYIGEKGIGFKSVFRVTSIPHILSKGYRFCLPKEDQETGLGFIVPKLIDILPNGTDLNQTTIILPLDKEKFNYEAIETMLSKIEPETILFLSKLKELKIFTDTGDNITIYKVDSKDPLIEIMVEGTRHGESFSKVDKFLFYTKSFDKPPDIIHEKRIGIDRRDVSIAFPLSKGEESAGKIFAFLPVRSEPCIPFLINADFILTSSREEIQEEERWNKWLALCVAQLIGESLDGLKKYHHLTVDFLEKLLKGILALKEKNLLFPIAGAIRKVLKTEDLLPAYNGTFIKVNQAKLARGKDLVELFSPEQLGFLFGKQELFWINPSITESGANADLHTYLVGRKKYQWSKDWEIEPLLEGLQVDPDDLAPKLTADFLGSQPLPWLVKFIHYAADGTSAIKRTPFIRLVCGKQVSLPINEKVPRTAWFAPADATELDLKVFPIVHPEISYNEYIRKFLEKEGIREIDAIAIVEKSILPKYKEPYLYFDEKSYKTDLNQIHTAYNKANDKEKIQLTTILNNYQWIATVHASGKEPNKIKWEKPGSLAVFEKTTDNEIWFEGLDDVNAYFLHFSVTEALSGAVTSLAKPTIVLSTNLSTNEYTILLSNEYYGKHKQGLKGFDPKATIVGIQSAFANWSQERSKVLWKALLSEPLKIISGETQSATNQQKLNNAPKTIEYTCVGDLCYKNPWLFDKNGYWHKPSDLLLNDLPEGYETTSIAAKELSVKLGMKQPEREQALEFVTGGNPDRKRRVEIFLSQPDDEQEKMIRTFTREIPPQPPEKDSPERSFDYDLELFKSFNRSGETKLKGETSNEGNLVKDPERRIEKETIRQVEMISAEPDPENRRRTTERTILEGPDEQVRKTLEEWYGGKCQICDSTFVERDGRPFFIANYIVDRKHARQVDTYANAICLCAEHFAKWQHGTVDADNIGSQINSLKLASDVGVENLQLKVKLCGDECVIRFKKKHVIALQGLRNAYGQYDVSDL